VWSRIHHTLSQISESSQTKIKYSEGNKEDIVLGVLFSRFIWTLINSSLIEECRYKYEPKQEISDALKNAKNTNTSPRELINNINYLRAINVDFEKDLPFTYHLIRCPLLWPFIGSYLDGNGIEKNDLFNTICDVLDTPNPMGRLAKFIKFNNVKDSYIEVAENIEASRLRISALPIMGFFRA